MIETVGAPFVKIGWTRRRVDTRIRQIQTCTPHLLRLLASFAGSSRDERGLHVRFADHRVRAGSEWFHLDGDVLAFVEGLQRTEVAA